MKMKIVALIGVVTAITLAVVIAVVATSLPPSPDPQPQTGGMKGTVVLNVGSANVSGTLELVQSDPSGPVTIKGTLEGLTPMGQHGFHVHSLGDVSGGCGSTKGHFNPLDKTHGAPGDETRHAGDLGNIISDDKGVAVIEISDSKISLFPGTNSIIGRAFVVHEKVDDLGKGGDADSLKTGNAGSRLKCGVVGIA